MNGQQDKLLHGQVVFGAADGLTVALGLVVSLTGQPAALVHAAFGAGLAELVGMTAGQWLSDTAAGLRPAIANGTAAFAACAIPAIPFLAAAGLAARVSSLILIAAIGAVIAWLRPQKGAVAAAQTFGVLAAAAVLCWAAALI